MEKMPDLTFDTHRTKGEEKQNQMTTKQSHSLRR